jgi:hypothetical protein
MAGGLRSKSCMYIHLAILICDQKASATNQKLAVVKLHVASLQRSAN